MNKMTSRERVSRSMRGQKPDKLPTIVINSNTFMCQYYGISVEEYVTHPSRCAEVNIQFIREFEVDCDVIATGYILYGAGPEIGVEWKFVGDNFPGHVNSPIKTASDLQNMRIPDKPSGYFHTYLQAVRIVIDALGDTHHLKASFLGPFSLNCFLRGIEQTLYDLLSDTDFFCSCMEYCTQLSVYLGKNLLRTGLRYPILNEIFLAPGMMNPRDYHSRVAPYILEVQRRIGIDLAPNCFTFMGVPGRTESSIVDKDLFKAFFGVGESIEILSAAAQYRVPGFPFAAAVSGRALNAWDSSQIVGFLRDSLQVLVREKGLYPAISFASVQADTRESALNIAGKIRTVNQFRDDYPV